MHTQIKIKQTLLCITACLGLLVSSTVFALGGYKCTVNQAYGVTNEGILQNDEEEYPNYWIQASTTGTEFTIDRATGRFLGGQFPIKGGGETFTIVSPGDKDTKFKAYFAEPWSGWMMSINVIEYSDSYRKPFVYFISPEIVLTGTCVNY